MDIDFTDEEASKVGKRRALEVFGWMYGFAVLLWLIGFYIAIPLMVLAYMLRHKETLVMTILLLLVQIIQLHLKLNIVCKMEELLLGLIKLL